MSPPLVPTPVNVGRCTRQFERKRSEAGGCAARATASVGASATPAWQSGPQHVATAAAAATNDDMQHAPSAAAAAASVGQGWSMEVREEKQVNVMPTRRKLPIGPKATSGGKSDRPQGEILVRISLNFPRICRKYFEIETTNQNKNK